MGAMPIRAEAGTDSLRITTASKVPKTGLSKWKLLARGGNPLRLPYGQLMPKR
jgi:hypothetical protein